MLAPHPFFQERGTPIAVDLLLRVLSQDGHRVDVLTYHEGEPRSYHGVTIHRIASPPGVRRVGPGFSLKKLICDAWMAVDAVRLVRRLRPDIIHAVEESVFMAWAMQPLLHVPYVYDMDSHLAAQVVEKHGWMGVFSPLFRPLEHAAIRRAVAVAPVCRALGDVARAGGAQQITLLPDISLASSDLSPVQPALPPSAGTRLLYVGNLEAYQGIDLLLDAFIVAHAVEPSLTLTVVGGIDTHIRRYQAQVSAQDWADAVQFTGPRPVDQLGALLAEGDILVSPRIKGANTPMKVFSYLHSGKPVLATRLPTHTQVLTDDIACLADPTPKAWSTSILALVRDPATRRRLGQAGRAYAEQHHTLPAFIRQVRELYAAPVPTLRP